MRQGQAFLTGAASLIRGCAWHVYPDPAGLGALVGDNPFGAAEPPRPERAPIEPPPGVVEFWLVGKNTPGIANDHDGHTYLVLTNRPEPPPVSAGWYVEPARLSEDFQIDQRGDRWVRMVRIIQASTAQSGAVLDCEFQVDRG